MRVCYGFILLGILLGCQSAQSHWLGDKRSVAVTFISFPQGAFIEVDKLYKGRTPSIVELSEYPAQRDHTAESYQIFIYPPQEEGYCTQEVSLKPYQLPEQLVFDLTKCPSGVE